MGRFRAFVVGLVAVALVSLGAAACTPADQTKAEVAIQTFVNFIPAIIAFNIVAAACAGRSPCFDG